MAKMGRPRKRRAEVKRNFVAVRLADHEWHALNDYRKKLAAEQDADASPAEIMRLALRVFLGEQLNPKPTFVVFGDKIALVKKAAKDRK